MQNEYEKRLRDLEGDFKRYQERVAEVLGEYQNQINDLRGLVGRLGERVVKAESRRKPEEAKEPAKVEGAGRLMIPHSEIKGVPPRDEDYYEGVDLIGD